MKHVRERPYLDTFVAKPWRVQRDLVLEAVRSFLARHKGSMATVTPSKIAYELGLPPKVPFLQYINAALQDLFFRGLQIEANGNVWIPYKYEKTHQHNSSKYIYTREGVEPWEPDI